MNYTAFLKYYIDINFLNLVFSLVIGLFSNALWGVLNFASFGIFVGYWGFHLFKENEYYIYHNLGFTKKNLVFNVFLINSIVSLLVSILLFLF
ncbi:conserved protein of unknown function [Tenacibaculum jejuense]|uniref:Uncharacterized protein n=1 Tax=Tenacibaculum jejuense TaxID=584609 RepID=A0A238U7L4_9FLAO|nr:conserved protein of unknown function [Tenacibaculum jejuense]